jgi:hypothetical protein
MSVIKAKIQTVEEMYRLIWTAVANKRPISAIYKELPRLFCLIGWAATVWVNLACSAISTPARAKADWGRSGRRITGVALCSGNYAEWSY